MDQMQNVVTFGYIMYIADIEKQTDMLLISFFCDIHYEMLT